MTNSSPLPGWYDDPQTPGQQRWWDGIKWTDHVQPNYQTPPAPPQQGAWPSQPSGTYGGGQTYGSTGYQQRGAGQYWDEGAAYGSRGPSYQYRPARRSRLPLVLFSLLVVAGLVVGAVLLQRSGNLPLGDRVEPLSQSELQKLVFSREDFPYEWTTAVDDAASDQDEEQAAEQADAAYARCMGLDEGYPAAIAELSSDDFTYGDSLEVSSSVTQYRNHEEARADFEPTTTAAGRECLRQGFQAMFRMSEEPGVEVADVLVSSCEKLALGLLESACMNVEVYFVGERTGPSGVAVASEIHLFLRDDVLVSVVVTQYSWVEAPDEALLDTLDALRALTARIAAMPTR